MERAKNMDVADVVVATRQRDQPVPLDEQREGLIRQQRQVVFCTARVHPQHTRAGRHAIGRDRDHTHVLARHCHRQRSAGWDARLAKSRRVAPTIALHISLGSCSAPPPAMNRVVTGRLDHATRRAVGSDKRDFRSAGAQIDRKHTFRRHTARLRPATPLRCEREGRRGTARAREQSVRRPTRADSSTARRHHESKLRGDDRPW